MTKILIYGAGATWTAFFCLEPEWSEPESAPGLELLEPEPPKQVPAPQHCLSCCVSDPGPFCQIRFQFFWSGSEISGSGSKKTPLNCTVSTRGKTIFKLYYRLTGTYTYTLNSECHEQWRTVLPSRSVFYRLQVLFSRHQPQFLKKVGFKPGLWIRIHFMRMRIQQFF